MEQDDGTLKESESVALPRSSGIPQTDFGEAALSNRQVDLSSESEFSFQKVAYFQTDTSEVEELFDSSGAEVFNTRPTLIPLEQGATTSSEVTGNVEPSSSGGIPPVTLAKTLNSDGQLPDSGRTLLRDYFAEASSDILAIGHATVAFNRRNNRQIHTVIRVISDESVITSMHGLKTMLEKAIRVGARSQRNKLGQGRQKVRCFRRRCESSVGDGKQSEDTAGGYTSGALSSDDDFVSFEAGGTKRLDFGDFRRCKIPSTSTAVHSDSPSVNVVPSPGYSVGDYEPLSNLRSHATPQSVIPSPSRKRRHPPGRPGKMMKEAYFKGIPWTRTFDMGPYDPEHKKLVIKL